MLERTLALVVSAPSYRDTMYVGLVTHHPSGWLIIEKAVNILSYAGGIEAITKGPESCKIKPTTGKCLARVPVCNVSVVVDVQGPWLLVLPSPSEVVEVPVVHP